MDSPRAHWQVSGRPWIVKLAIPLVLIVLYRIFSHELAIMRSNPVNHFMATVAASLAYHRMAAASASVDISWHPPNATAINNLTQVLQGSDVYGFIYNSSTTPDDRYGEYNWCNMPHVRPLEYKKPSSDYKLQYVEVVSAGCPFYFMIQRDLLVTFSL